VPTDWQFKMVNGLHRGVVKLSGGRIGGRMGRMPILELITTGAKSGQSRSVMLVSPVKDGDNLVIVASRGGDDRNPAWFYNLRANPNVSVSVSGQPAQAMRARVASADERARLWPQIIAAAANYAGYQKKTDREIPVVLLESPERASA
jgi:deazaflavin-dependent oxidoreductase (nitroreductase family)